MSVQSTELRITGPGSLLIVRGRIAWCLWRLAKNARLAEDMEHMGSAGHFEADWGPGDELLVQTRTRYKLGA